MPNMDKKFTTPKYSFGVCGEFAFQAHMDINYQFELDNLNNTNKYSVVDFRIPTTNIYIELKTRTCTSTAFSTTYFDKSKVDRWNRSKQFKNAIIYIAFAFKDGQYYCIKYSKRLFSKFKTSYRSDWDQTNYKIPLSTCINTDKIITQINKLKPNCLHVN